jgi:hypothetical protein
LKNARDYHLQQAKLVEHCLTNVSEDPYTPPTQIRPNSSPTADSSSDSLSMSASSAAKSSPPSSNSFSKRGGHREKQATEVPA